LKIQKAFENSMERARREFENSPVERMKREFENSPVERMKREFESSTTEIMRREFENSSAEIMRKEFESSSAEIMKKYLPENSIASKIWDEFQHSSVDWLKEQYESDAVRKLVKDSQSASERFQKMGVYEPHVSSFLSEIQNSSVLKVFSEFNNSPFQQNISFDSLPELFPGAESLKKVSQTFVLPYDFHDIELEIEEEYAKGKDYNSLSDKAKKVISYVYHSYVLPLMLSTIVSIAIMYYADEIQKVFANVKTKQEIVQTLKKPPFEIKAELLKDFCLVTGDGLRLREKPKMKSKIITQLPRGKIAKMIEKSKRNWLQVEVDFEDEILTGWISKRYTTKFK
jgi:uncharacterized protein YgiM (DUF1202 family)